MHGWCLLIVVVHFIYLWQNALASQSSPTTEGTGCKEDINTLRQLVNQLMMMTMSLSRNVHSLFEEQRALVMTNQATNKTLTDVQTETEALKRQSLNLSNEVSSFIKNTQAVEKNLTTQVKGVKTNLLGYADAIVQAACAAVSSDGHVSAIRRYCSSSYPSCDELCKISTPKMKSKINNEGGNQARCVKAFHLYRSREAIHPSSDGQVNRIMYHYHSSACFVRYCGPNYCCCRV